ncbi:MAG: permease [Candidatus Saccharibacteria bacterium]|nr:permease [Candidatus Saccharibacteria bacterium]
MPTPPQPANPTARRRQRRASFLGRLGHLRQFAWLLPIALPLILVLLFQRPLQFWLYAHPPHTWGAFLAATAQDFLTLTLSVIVEATPFLILGIGLSALIRRFVPLHRVLPRLPKNAVLRRLILSSLGLALPVCECGNVPVARSLLRHGLSPADTISFLFAAPILNPITIIATAAAFSGTPHIVWWRVIFALVIVQVVALIVSRLRSEHILQPDFAAHCHGPEDRSLDALFNFSRQEFWQLFRMLTFGAMLAAATQVFIPRDIITAVGGDLMLSVVAMILLGFVVSICSSVDAFFALAYTTTFRQGALLAFLLAGPMIDIKMIALLKSTFTMRFTAIVTALVFGLSLLIGVGVNLYVG